MTSRERRFALVAGTSAFGWALAGAFGLVSRPAHAAKGAFEITRTNDEWRKLLSPKQYAVLREEGTERPYTSPLNDEHRAGIFACAGCNLDAFSSKTKFDSKTGWPSFWQPLTNAVATTEDRTFGMARVEVHCRRCGSHFGHLFDDGPKPTGLRYCMNGVSLKFTPA